MITASGGRGVWNLVRARHRHHRALRLWRAGLLHRAQQQILRAIALYDVVSATESAGALLTLGDFLLQLRPLRDA